MLIMAIDPGNTQTAFVLMDSTTYKPYRQAKLNNKAVVQEIIKLVTWESPAEIRFVIERVACYGMPVGREVFDTCEWIGRFSQLIELHGHPVHYVFRADEKQDICHSPRANDATIHQALVDRFAKHDLKTGKGTKKDPDWFYGFKADMWAAYAVGVTYIDKMKEEAM